MYSWNRLSSFLMKKFIFFLLSVLLFTVSAKAYYLSPANGNQLMGSSSTIKIYASPATTTDMVAMIRISLNNATVTSFSQGSNITAAPGACNGGTQFTSTSVCVDLGKSSPFTNNELIGSFTVTWSSSPSTAIATKITGSGYYNGSVTSPSIGEVGNYTVGSIPATPFTPDLLPEILLATSGLIVMFFGIYLIQKINDEKISENEIS